MNNHLFFDFPSGKKVVGLHKTMGVTRKVKITGEMFKIRGFSSVINLIIARSGMPCCK